MKVVNIASSYSSRYAGNFIPSLFALAKKLEKNYRVIFSFPDKARNRFWVDFLIKNKFKVAFFSIDSNRRTITSLKKINKDNKVSIFYSHFISTPIVKMLSPFSHRLKMVIHIHSDFRCGNKRLSFNSKFKRLIFEKIIRKDASYIYVSDAMMSESKGVNCYYVRNALSVDRIISQDRSNKSIASMFSGSKINFLTFGWSPKTKGVDIVCKAFTEMEKECQNQSKLFIVANENGKEEIVDFIKNTVNIDLVQYPNIIILEPQEDVFELYKNCDVFISSSRSEGFSYSILESLYFGLKVLMSDIDGTRWAQEFGAKTFNLANCNELKILMENSILTGRFDKKINTNLLETFSISNWVEKVTTILERNI